MRLLYDGNRLLHLICNLDKYGCLFSFCSHLSLPSSQCTVVDGSLLKVQDHWSEVCKRLVRSYFQWYFNNFYEFHCIVWKLFELVWHWASNLKPCRIVLMQALIYATFSLWHLCHTEIQPALGTFFDDVYFTFVYFLREKCLLEMRRGKF